MSTRATERMPIFKRVRSGWVAFALIALAVSIIIALLLRTGSPLSQASDGFLDAQHQALRPGFRSEISGLRSAPRYALTATIDTEAGSYSGQVRIGFTNQSELCLAEVMLRLYANSPTIYGGQLDAQRIVLDDRQLDFEIVSPTTIRIPLQTCLEPQDQLILIVDFEGRILSSANRGYGIHGSSPLGVALTGWHPMLALPVSRAEPPAVPVVGDALVAGISLTEASVEVPERFSLITTGVVVNGVDGEPQRIVTGPARELAVVAWEGASPESRIVAGVQIRCYAAADDSKVLTADHALDLASQIRRTYQQLFGPYPYSQLDIVEWPVAIGGYEFSGLVFIDDELRAGAEADLEFLLAHELAHQWWYGIVGNDQVAEPWLDEGLANYAVLLYLDQRSDGQAGQALLQEWRERYGVRNHQDPALDSPATDFDSWDPYRRTAYIHGALFLVQLEEEMGKARFLEFLRAYASQYRYGIATSIEFLKLAQEFSDTDLSPIFNQWFSQQLVE